LSTNLDAQKRGVSSLFDVLSMQVASWGYWSSVL